MDKIKVALTSGSTIEKPLVSAFKASTGAYVVLDNEVNGTMGLPIILVAKYNENRLIKINDQNEWNGVKEVLRNIISGNQVDYISIPTELMADDGFFSQLTLPIASFDSLKANYKPSESGTNTSTVAPVENTPMKPNMPEVPPMPDVQAMNQFNSVGATPITPTVSTPEPPVAPMPSPIEPSPIPTTIPEPTPQVESAPEAPSPVTPVMPEPPVVPTPEVAPVVEPIPPQAQNDVSKVDFSVEKEAFMKACENMFDALVAKFNK